MVVKRSLWPTLLLCLATLHTGAATPEGVQFFERKIRPVLVKHCYECHSATAKNVGGKLFLDTKEGLLRGGESGPGIVPGNPEESLFIRALQRGEDDLIMPPEDKAPLSEVMIRDLTEWVRMGAPDPRTGSPPEATNHVPDAAALWSFDPLSAPSPPTPRDTSWPVDPLDRFILARLEAAGHRPVPDASASTLIRRLYFDLIGLAPTMDEVTAFAEAHAKNPRTSLEAFVDHLLASPHFGERWGRHWLDVARFGESNGNDGLGRNPTFPHAWRYRDYVIEAFNNDVAYDRFLKEQIAGDLLPATSHGERARNLTATGFLAIGHKPAAAMNQNFAMDVVDDQVNVVSTAVMGLSVSCARCHDHKHDPITTRDYYALAGIFTSTETLWGNAANENLTAPPTALHDLSPKKPASNKPSPAVLTVAKGYSEEIAKLKPTLHASLNSKPSGLILEKGVEISGKEYAKLKEGRILVEGPLSSNSYSVSFWFRNDLPNNARPITTYLLSLGTLGDAEQKGDNLGIGGTHVPGRTGKLFLWTGTKNDENAHGESVLAPASWHHLVFVREDQHVRLYLNGVTKPEIDAEIRTAAPPDAALSLAARMDRFAPLEGALAHLAVFDRALTADEAKTLQQASGHKPGTVEPPKPAFAMGVRDKEQIADCKINIDGNSKKLGPAVPRGFLPACKSRLSPPTIASGSSGRLQLTDWLTRGDHPQTARVMVNRVWLHLFGRGIVATPDDFGVYGARPSHPELLDHLAQRFIDDGWSIKKLIRTIVLSRTYQLGSDGNPGLVQADSDNELFGRHTRRRLDAETIRDRLLQASGKLVLSPATGSDVDDLDILINWPPGEARYLHRESHHRSVYLCALRNSPPPELAAFNFPAGTTVTGQRETSTPPTQALFFLNNPLVVEQARVLAEQTLTRLLSEEQGIAHVFQRILQRNPTTLESDQARRHIKDLEGHLSGADATVRAWASFCQALLASNEFRYID